MTGRGQLRNKTCFWGFSAFTGISVFGFENEHVVAPDGSGTARAILEGIQAITSTLTTEAFGNPVAQWGNSANPYRFAGAWGCPVLR